MEYLRTRLKDIGFEESRVVVRGRKGPIDDAARQPFERADDILNIEGAVSSPRWAIHRLVHTVLGPQDI